MNVLIDIWQNYMKCPYDYPFDLSGEPDPYGYFEVLIGRDGNVFNAPNGHQRGVTMMIARDKNITPKEVDEQADVINYTEWLLKESKAIMIWHKYYMGNPNEAQQNRIVWLKNNGFMAKDAKQIFPSF